MTVREFLERNFRHFNARETLAAAQGYERHLREGGCMLMTLAGAMSTAELGISLSEMIRRDKVQAICCTAANLEEDLFNLVAHDDYRILPNYRDLSPVDETRLCDEGFNRVTDTCIPETVMRHLERRLMEYWQAAAADGESYFPFEYFYRLFEDSSFAEHFQIDPADSWVYAAWKKKLPIYSPGFEDSTLGNIFTARIIEGRVGGHHAVRTGTEQMQHLVDWYIRQDSQGPVGFFQIGGGIAGDFAICAVPLIIQDLKKPCRTWQYFAQISDSTTSYGSYSGAVPNEKITWCKLDARTPRYMINSDASIVAPLIFAYLLDW